MYSNLVKHLVSNSLCFSDLAHYSITPLLHHSITPSLRVAGFENQDESEAPGEQLQPATRVQFAAGAILQHSATPTRLFRARTPNANGLASA